MEQPKKNDTAANLRRYQLSVTENQAQVISDALEFWSRIAMGQLGEITYLHLSRNLKRPELQDLGNRQYIDRTLDEVKRVLFGLKFAQYYSIGSPDIGDCFRVAYDLHQVIRYRLAWDRNPKKDIMNVHKDEPMRYGMEGLAEFKEIKNGINEERK